MISSKPGNNCKFENRYSHLQELPAFNEIIDAMNDNALLPNDEINLRKKMKTILEDNLIS